MPNKWSSAPKKQRISLKQSETSFKWSCCWSLFCDLSHGSCYGSPPPSKKYLYFSTCPHFVKMQGCTSLENIKTSTAKIKSNHLFDIWGCLKLQTCEKISSDFDQITKRTCRLCGKGHDGAEMLFHLTTTINGANSQTYWKQIIRKSAQNGQGPKNWWKSLSFEGIDTSHLTSVLPPPPPSKMLLKHLSE